LTLFSGLRAQDKTAEEDQDKYRALATFAGVLEMIHNRYIDSDKASYERLIRAAIKGMLQDLDHYTGYENREEHRESVRVLGGETVGVGLVVNKKHDSPLEIITPLEASPAEAAGLRPGSFILKINDTDTAKISLRDCLKLIQGKPDTTVKLMIRYKDEAPYEVTLPRKNIAYSSIPPHGIKTIGDDIGYVRIMVFNSHTAADFDRAMRKLNSSGVKSLIIDLRNNPGGLLNSAVDLASRFLKPDSVILYTSSRDSEAPEAITSRDTPKGVAAELPVVVLVNELSASASEIFTGALMDNGRAVSVGARTFGKATVQNIQELPDGSAIRLTIGRYLTPSRKPIQGIGIAPNEEILVPQTEKNAFYSQLAVYPGVVKPDSPNAVTDTALARAIEKLKQTPP
jgi:carboxyl-terminal processing protease